MELVFQFVLFSLQVLWMRQRDLHILTSALHVYTNDLRISSIHSIAKDENDAQQLPLSDATAHDFSANGHFSTRKTNAFVSRSSSGINNSRPLNGDDEDGYWSEWTLRIRSAQVKDAGLFECQVSTEPKISRLYRLNVVGK